MCRDLKASEIDVRVQSIREDKDKNVTGLILLLYKNARVDMDILDEEFGKFGWQRHHEFKDGRLYCTVSIWDEAKRQWISREDVGTESNTEAEKGQASDAFKRANVNFGIGRELYTAPLIYISPNDFKHFKNAKGFNQTNDKFSVENIEIKDKQIIGLSIRNDTTGNIVYTFGTLYKPKSNESKGKKSQDKQTPMQTQNEPKNEVKEPQRAPFAISYEDALNYVIDCKLYFGKTLRDVYHTDRKAIQQIYELGSAKLKRAIEVIEAEIARSKQQ